MDQPLKRPKTAPLSTLKPPNPPIPMGPPLLSPAVPAQPLTTLPEDQTSALELHEASRIRDILRSAPVGHWGPINVIRTPPPISHTKHYQSFLDVHRNGGLESELSRGENIISLRYLIARKTQEWMRYSPVRRHPDFRARFRGLEAELEECEAFLAFLLQTDREARGIDPQEKVMAWEDGYDPTRPAIDCVPSIYSTVVPTGDEATPILTGRSSSLPPQPTDLNQEFDGLQLGEPPEPVPSQREYTPSVVCEGDGGYTGMMTRARTRELVGMIGKYPVTSHEWPEQSGRS